jgi:uncharacterized protein (UPF0333 family)
MKLIEMRGQLSIEFMIIFSAVLSVLFVFISASMNFAEASEFFLELKKAETFAEKTNSVLNEIYSFSSGSKRTISENISFPWIVSCKNKICFIEVFQKKNSKKIEFVSLVPVNDFDFSFNKKIEMVFLNEEGIILVNEI